MQRLCEQAAIIRAGRIIAVEEIDDHGAAPYKSLRVRFKDPEFVSDISGLKSAEVPGQGFKCMVQGDLHALVRCLAEYDLADLSIKGPPWEEIFMDFYTDRGDVTSRSK